MPATPDLSRYFTMREYNRHHKKVVYLFGGWRTGLLVYRPLARRFNKLGYGCVLYLPKTNMIAVGKPYAEIVTACKLAIADVKKRIEIDRQAGITTFACFGISFGTIFAMETAKTFGDIKTVILLSPFGDFAEHIELWPRHWYFRQVVRSQPTTPAESAAILNEIGAAKDLIKLKDKRLLISYATKDQVIHSSITRRLAESLQAADISLNVVATRGKHISGIIYYLWRDPSYMEHLKSAGEPQ